MNKITTLHVYRSKREGDFSVSEEKSAAMRAFVDFKMRHLDAMNARDGVSPILDPRPSPATLQRSPRLRVLRVLPKAS